MRKPGSLESALVAIGVTGLLFTGAIISSKDLITFQQKNVAAVETRVTDAPRMTGYDQETIRFTDDQGSLINVYAFRPGEREPAYLGEKIADNGVVEVMHPPKDLYPKYTVIAIDGEGHVSKPTYFEVLNDVITEGKR